MKIYDTAFFLGRIGPQRLLKQTKTVMLLQIRGPSLPPFSTTIPIINHPLKKKKKKEPPRHLRIVHVRHQEEDNTKYAKQDNQKASKREIPRVR